MNKKGFIFDLDGVIVDTAKYHFLAWKKLAKSVGITFSEAQNEQLKGVSRVRSLEKILTWGKKEISEDQFMELMARKNNDYLDYISNMDEGEILPDVPRILNLLKEMDQPFSLGSASKNARAILKEVELLNDFKIIVDGTNVVKAKPDPAVFLKAARMMKIDPDKCIVFEDAVAGIQAANAAGMLSIGIGSPEILHEANCVFNDFTEISDSFIIKLINE
ncbi:MAG: beta-phosphoglucomutase [Flavobacteriaceae bacterium]|nr:beta-phosphoglucomutase [Flavobacteriaceae bacterium]